MKGRKLLRLVIPAVIALIMLPGCKKDNTKYLTLDEAEQRMRIAITQRYGNDFTVENVRDIDHTGDGPFSGNVGADADGYDSQHRKFLVRYDGKTDQVLDDYGKYAHEEEIAEILTQELSRYPFMTVEYHGIIYPPSNVVWDADNRLEDYLKKSGVEISERIRIDDTQTDYAGEIAALAESLHRKGVPGVLYIHQGTKHMSIRLEADRQTPSADAIRKELG